MTGRWKVVTLLAVLICLTAAGALALSWLQQEAALQNALSARERLASDIRRYVAAASRSEDSLFGAKPTTDIEGRFARTLSAAGITPAPRFAVSVDGDRESHVNAHLGGRGLREQYVSLRVPSLTTRQIGEVLARWVSMQQVWSPTRIELHHEPRSDDDRYTLHLECVAVYSERGGLNDSGHGAN